MSSSNTVTAVFDIGKTNKKFLLFDDAFSIVHQSKKTFDETVDDDGFACDNLELLTDWIFLEFEKVMRQAKFAIKTVNFSTYGATLVHLDKDGNPATPLYNYLKPYPENLSNKFYQKYGGRKAFSRETSSPPMGMLNSGLQLYWLKKQKPELFKKIETTLHFPQYLSYLFTGRFFAEHTSIGCHTGLWNFQKGEYHSWLKTEGLLNLLPPVQSPRTVTGGNFRGKYLNAGIGIHDSSAALAPYLAAFDEPFIQLSTGTWGIAMNPFTTENLTFDELEKDCLSYLNIYARPVKASRFLLGGEYRHQMEKIGEHFNKNPEKQECSPDLKILQRLVTAPDQKKKLILEKAAGSGLYPGKSDAVWELNHFNVYEEAVHQCMLDLVSIQADALKLAAGKGKINQVIITGGFAKNQFFCRLLATMIKDSKVYTASVPEASALGAAIVVQQNNINKKELNGLLQLNLQKPFDGIELDGYSWASGN